MAQDWAKAFYNSIKWLRCRNAYIQQRIVADGGLCEECHKEPGHIVHHKIVLGAGGDQDEAEGHRE